MTPIKVMVNGMPGNMATNVARHVLRDNRFELIRRSLTGPEITQATHDVDGTVVELIRPDARDAQMDAIVAEKPLITVDYSHPSAVNANARFYCERELPFVMGTTGGNRDELTQTVLDAPIAAVIAPNMAKQIVGFQAMIEYAARTYPGLFEGYTLTIEESHQRGKADTSGTARAMVKAFNRLGTPFDESDIVKERDPAVQKEVWGVPEEYLTGHGYHTYTLVSADRDVVVAFSHNVNGRDVYARGTIDAIAFLSRKVAEGAKGRVYSMIDVLQG